MEFYVELVEYNEEAPVTLKPMLIEAKGKFPKQYGEGY